MNLVVSPGGANNKEITQDVALYCPGTRSVFLFNDSEHRKKTFRHAEECALRIDRFGIASEIAKIGLAAVGGLPGGRPAKPWLILNETMIPDSLIRQIHHAFYTRKRKVRHIVRAGPFQFTEPLSRRKEKIRSQESDLS